MRQLFRQIDRQIGQTSYIKAYSIDINANRKPNRTDICSESVCAHVRYGEDYIGANLVGIKL